MLYKLIWLLLQLCLTIFQYLRLSVQYFLQKVNMSYDRRRGSDCTNYTDFSSEQENAYLNNCKTQLNKLPRHLTLLIGPDEQIGDDLIKRIISYALQMNIKCVSFYDTRTNENQRIQLHSLQHPNHITSKKLGDRHFLWTVDNAISVCSVPNGKTTDTHSNGYSNTNTHNRINGQKNGFKEGKSIEIFQIESCDGRALIADVCRKLFIQRKSSEIQELLKDRAFLSERIDKDLSQHLWHCTDPDLCIVFSKHMCTFGMLPWHTRFTEFYLHQQEDLFNVKTFAKILFQYSRCEQRWGK